MAVERFQVGFFGEVEGVALDVYHPWMVDGSKNPKFYQHKHSRLILDLKKADNRNYAGAVAYFSDALCAHLAQQPLLPNTEIVLMPSHNAGGQSAGLQAVAQNLCARDRRFVWRPGSLTRTATIEKRARGGNRSVRVHHDSLEYHPHPAMPGHKIVIDDVATTCNSLQGAVDVIKAVDPAAFVSCLVLAKTVHE